MRQKRTLRGLPLLAAALLVANACADQGEGERCSQDNDNADCAAGLVCTPVSKLSVSGSAPKDAALCCPPVGVPPSVDACQAKFGSVPDGGGFVDAGAQHPAPPDASVKPKPDASLSGDARPDARPDAP